jgi:hypothetical protein
VNTTDTSPTARTQCERILAILQAGNTLTPLTALDTVGCMALSQRIGNLRRDGHSIVKEMVHDERTGKRYMSYRLARPSEQMRMAI